MSLFQNYRLFLGLYSKYIATYWEFEDCRWSEMPILQQRLEPGIVSITLYPLTRPIHASFLTLEAADFDERGVSDKFGDVLVYHNFKY